MLKRILREPLLHFMVLGAALFVILGGRSKDKDEPRRIIITQAQIRLLADDFARTWQRSPTGSELDALIQDRVREEVYCREALALGLDQDDAVIRRRLRQKFEFLGEDTAALVEPTDADLDAFLQAHPEMFRREAQLTFSHVYLSPERRGAALAGDVAAMLRQLRQAGGEADAVALGDPFLLAHRFEATPLSDVRRLFGDGFAAGLAGLDAGAWHGPVESAFGMHLVFIHARTAEQLPGLADVRDDVRREWANDRRLEAQEKFYAGLRDRYTVTIEPPVLSAP